MAVKNISTRMKICGRGAKCSGGHSAVEQSGYICREKMYSEYDGQTYYPKYAEDLVHSEVLLPENAPEEFKDPAKLWNSVEMAEKGDKAQLARTWRIELPNLWTYAFAILFVRELCERLFVSKGMCVQFAIHDSENDKGQRNLHCHIMLTLRSLDEQGHWMPKQKKVYLTDENGERIPIIDKKTGEQKVDKQNRKQWKCTTIKTIRGNINRDIIAQNAIIMAARAAYEKAKEELAEAMAIPVDIVKAFKSEIIDVIRKVAERNNNRLTLPIMKGKFIGAVSDRAALQDKAKMEAYVQSKGWTTFDEMQADRKALRGKYDELEASRSTMTDRMAYLEKLLDYHAQYEPYQKVNAEYWKLKKAEDKNGKPLGFFKKSQAEEYKRKHQTELNTYKIRRDVLKDMIKETDKKINPKAWQKELDGLREKYQKTERPLSEATLNLAKMEVLSHNKRDLERMLQNERGQKEHEINRTRRKDHNL